MKKLLLILLCAPLLGWGQEVIYGEEIKKMKKVVFGDEITAHYFTIKFFDEQLEKYIVAAEGFCESNLLPLNDNCYYFKFENCLNKISESNSWGSKTVYKIFWNHSEELSSKDKDVYATEGEDGTILEFNYKDQTISYYITGYCMTISKLEIK